MPILGVAFIVRLVVGVHFGWPGGSHGADYLRIAAASGGGDAFDYLTAAHNLAAGHGFSYAAHAPYSPSDWRLPGYPALLVPVLWLGLGHTGVVLLNSLLGTAAVGAVALIARQIFSDRPRVQLAVMLVAAVYPSVVTFTAFALTENLLFAAGAWFLYLAFFSPSATRRPVIWLAGIFVVASLLSLTRAESVVIVVLGVLLAAVVRHLPRALAAAALVAVLLAPAAWVIRNDVAVGRAELSDSIYRDDNLLLSVDHGNWNTPLYLRGERLAHEGTGNAAARARFHSEVMNHISTVLRQSPGSVVSFKIKGLVNFFFVPPVVSWAYENFSSNYLASHAITHLRARSLLRLAWSLLLIGQYAAAICGLVVWWRRKRYREVLALLLYPAVALALTVPFQADQREWTFAAFILILPAAEGVLAFLPAGAKVKLGQALASPWISRWTPVLGAGTAPSA
jgi:hypothetical protein